MSLHFVPGVMALLIVALVSACAEESPLPNQKLGDLDLDAPPPGWSKAVPDHLTQVEEAGHGKVLKITGVDGQNPSVDITVDLASLSSEKRSLVTVTAKVPGACPSPGGKPEFKPKVVIEVKDSKRRFFDV